MFVEETFSLFFPIVVFVGCEHKKAPKALKHPEQNGTHFRVVHKSERFYSHNHCIYLRESREYI